MLRWPLAKTGMSPHPVSLYPDHEPDGMAVPYVIVKAIYIYFTVMVRGLRFLLTIFEPWKT